MKWYLWAFIVSALLIVGFAYAADPCLDRKIHNRGRPKAAVVAEIFKFAQTTPDDVFAKNNRVDIYSFVSPQLGPFTSLKQRRAALAEVLIVLSMFESSQRWEAGIDTTNASSARNKCNEEAGILQASGNSMGFSPTLKAYTIEHCGGTDCPRFITCSKDHKQYVIGYTGRLLRFTTNHHGPVKRKEINRWLSRECAKQIERAL